MASLTLLDTDIVIDYLVGADSAAVTEQLLHREAAAVSSITVYELFAGVTSKRHIAQRGEFIDLCEVVELTSSMARRAAELFTELKAAGRLIPNEDLLIAATALETGYPIYTQNRSHYERIQGLVLF